MTERRTVVLERTYDASPPEVWEMWTTKDGLESWWGPDGFRVEVHTLDLTPGGLLRYSMIAVAHEQVGFLEEAGMPTVTTQDITFTEVAPYRRLAYLNTVDFIPDVESYEAGTAVELAPTSNGTRLTLTLEAMHDEHWTGLAVAGWEQELEHLGTVLAGRKEQT